MIYLVTSFVYAVREFIFVAMPAWSYSSSESFQFCRSRKAFTISFKNAIDDIIQAEEQSVVEEQPEAKKEPWDFSREKSQATFACGDGIVIRPITTEDQEFYRSVRMQYSLIYKSAYYNA